MGANNDFSRRRLAEFLAARIRARRVEESGHQATSRESSTPVARRLDEVDGCAADGSDSIGRDASAAEPER